METKARVLTPLVLNLVLDTVMPSALMMLNL